MGRRLRIGAEVTHGAGLTPEDLPERYRFAVAPPPYDHFAGAADGLALWRDPPDGVGAAAFDPYDVPGASATFWQSTELVYDATFPVQDAPSLQLPRHRGGRVDWFSADAVAEGAVDGSATKSRAFPAPLEYPGAPATRWWEIEDAAVDIGGYPLAESSLVLWLRTVTPVEGDPIEDVLFGLDEYSNVLWAVEQRLDNRVCSRPHVLPKTRRPTPTLARPPAHIDPASRTYRYVPAEGTAPHWHPYQIDVVDGAGPRRFVQRRMVDLSRTEPEVLPEPVAEVLRVRADGGERVHVIEPATVPSIGMHIQRRYLLARDVDGNPLLWIQRQRAPVLRPPSRALRFDVMAEGDAAGE